MIKFDVIDNNTGKIADCEEIANSEKWADGLIFYDMWGFAILETGTLLLVDECGNYKVCPEDRFRIVANEEG